MQKQSQRIIKEALPVIKSAGDRIKEGKAFEDEKVSFADRFESTVINPLFYGTCISAKGFYYTDKCIGCGKCERLCPLNNIKLINGKPSWESRCTHCMACICGCPEEAIEYKNKSKGKTRYYNTDMPEI